MRVLMVSDVYFPRINGVSTSIETFRRCLAAEGVEVRLVAPQYGDEAATPDILRVPGRPVPGDPEDRLPGWRAMQQAVVAAAADCDLIHIQTPFVAHYAGLRVARRLDLPVLATYHTLFEEYVEHYAPHWLRRLAAGGLRAAARAWSRQQCNQLDALVVPSSLMRLRLEGYGVTTPMSVLPTGIPLGQFATGDRAAFRERYGIAAERPLALYVGRVAHEKNIGFLLQAMPLLLERCPEALLLIAGEGPALPALQRQVAAAGLQQQVRFLGYLDRLRDLPDCYAAADVFAFASRTETQGLVLLEAMAAGLPVVALAEMGTVDILGSGRGCRVPPGQPGAFAAALADCLKQPALRQQLGHEASVLAAEWSDQAMAARLAALYRDLCAEPRRRPARLRSVGA